MWKSFVLELHGEWSEFADECIGLLQAFEPRATCPEGRLFGQVDKFRLADQPTEITEHAVMVRHHRSAV
jgi:hypothetical protein